MAGWHHQLDGHEFEQTPGDGEGQGSLACCSPWGRKELDVTERLNNNNNVRADAHTCEENKTVPTTKAKRMAAFWERGVVIS